MFSSLQHGIGWILSTFGSRADLVLENLALRQQLLALHNTRSRRRLSAQHKLFWVLVRKLWSGWQKPLILVSPRTVVAWHRAGFRLYWKWLCRTRRVGGRRPVGREVRELVSRMAVENPTWGAPRIHGELLKLGFTIAEPTVSRWLRRMPRRRTWANVGWHSCETIARRSQRWISLPSQRLPLGFCTVSSSSTTIAGEFCAAMLRGIPVPSGSCSKCAKPGPTPGLRSSCYSTRMQSSAETSSMRPEGWEASPFAPHFAVLGRMERPSAGWEAAAEICWIM